MANNMNGNPSKNERTTVDCLASHSNESEIATEDLLASHPGYAHDADIGYQNKQWMSKIKDDVKISELSIPGTHGSMALYDATPFEDIAKNQTMSLTTQLNAGIRYFDMRARRTKDAFAMHHGPVYQKAMFGDVLNATINFLRQNPKETVLMRVKEEHDAEPGSLSFEAIFQNYWNNNTSYFWDPNSVPASERNNPKLRDVRGKIVVYQNFSSSKNFGISYGTLNNQDQYNVGKNPDGMYSKWTAVKNHLYAANNSNKSQIYLNHFSGTSGSFNGAYPWFVASGFRGKNTDNHAEMITEHRTDKWPDFPRGYYGQVFYGGTNILGMELIQRKAVAHTGIIAADFPGKGLIESVINLNAKFSSSDIYYVRTNAQKQLEIGFTGNEYLTKKYLIYKNGAYIAELSYGNAYYAYLHATDFGHQLTYPGVLFTGDKIQVFLDNNGNLTLLQSHTVSMQEDDLEEIRVADGSYIIKTALNNTSAIDMYSTSDRNVILWDYVNQIKAEFDFQYDDNKKAYRIRNRWDPTRGLGWNNSGGSINVFGMGLDASKDEQYWIIKRAGEGYVYLFNKKNGHVLDVTGGGTANGTNINVWGRVPGERNQKFKLIVRNEKLEGQIDSLYRPQSGQKNRSSGNFSLGHLPDGARVRVSIEGGGETVLNFRVMRDKSGDTDPTIWSNVKHGSIVTIASGANKNNLYIANPSLGSAPSPGGTFKVKFYTLYN
ncbi:phosphatidylinositol-specific phospholipase C domain-containing protein [Bacillus mycoides]|uniref:phosphatidylinositol-specific phospholipase C domain-containing protein n=1 Tax=Bacillus mycoides TaxID=1405 RepID=UPI00382477AC